MKLSPLARAATVAVDKIEQARAPASDRAIVLAQVRNRISDAIVRLSTQAEQMAKPGKEPR